MPAKKEVSMGLHRASLYWAQQPSQVRWIAFGTPCDGCARQVLGLRVIVIVAVGLFAEFMLYVLLHWMRDGERNRNH